MIKLSQLRCLAAATLIAVVGVSAADNILSIKANGSIAEIKPRAEKQRQLLLPALDVAMQASLACPFGATAESLTVSVSDTHEFFGAERLADKASLEAVLRVPANQLPPVSLAEFCIDRERLADESLSLPGIATAQASLRCRGDDNSLSLHFTSTPIPVTLYCRADGVADSSSRER